jgi:hypothetical protein
MALIDHYDRQARLLPAVILLLPLAIGTLPWVNGEELGWSVVRRAGLTGLVTLAIATLLMGLVRAAGKRKQDSLWEHWGGSPAVSMLRHDHKDLSPITRARYHSVLARALNLEGLPSAEEQRSDPAKADEVYRAAVDYMIHRTRDTKLFQLLYKENVNYGFHRNLWALRPFGIAFALIGTALCSARVWLEWDGVHQIDVFAVVAGLACVAMLLLWSFFITTEWVRVPAFAYARALLAATEHLAGDVKAG